MQPYLPFQRLSYMDLICTEVDAMHLLRKMRAVPVRDRPANAAGGLAQVITPKIKIRDQHSIMP